ncbi:hypothetical protein HC02_03630 [Vibrio parahaemolyticus]|nr:hypothetical protein HC02_03630 [Vibrio parahaemolyticus]
MIFFLKGVAKKTHLPIMRLRCQGKVETRKQLAIRRKSFLKINFKKCLTLRISSLEYASALREKLLEKQAL